MARSTVYNRITNEENLKLVNEDNKQLQTDFTEYLYSIDRSAQTIYQYNNDLNIFFVWNMLHNNNKFFIDIKKRDFVKFQNYGVNELGWSAKRIRRVKSVISSLSNYIENILDDEYEDYKSVITKIESPANKPVREKTILPDTLVEKLLDTLVRNKDYEKACVVAIFAHSGMRKSELMQMKLEYFEDSRIIFDSLYKTDKVRSKGRGKNGKQIYKYIMLKAKPYIDLWKEQRKELGIESEWLFVRKKDNEWVKRSYIDYWMKEFSEIVGMDVYPHSFRHFTCTLMMNEYNLPQQIVQEFFSWDSAEMLQIYNDKDMADDFGKYFTANGVVKQTQQGLGDLK